MTDEQMRYEINRVIRRVRWVTILLSVLGSTLSFGFVGGVYINRIESRFEAVEVAQNTDQSRMSLFQERVRALERRQQEAETSTARLEERLIAQAATLARIERLLETLARDAHDPRPR